MPMANQFTVYQWTDPNAPVLSTAAGGLFPVLDAILVNGYGSKIAAGWTKPFFNSASNTAVYQAPGGVQHYWQIVDLNAWGGVINGYETMSAFNTGTGQIGNSGTLIPKNGTNYGPNFPWICFADNRTVIFCGFDFGNISSQAWAGVYFGEYFSVQANNNYRSLLRAYYRGGNLDYLSYLSNSINAATPNSFVPRAYTGLGSQVAVAAVGDAAKGNSLGLLKGIVPLPNPEEGGLYLSPIWIADPTTSPANNLLGRMRGFWHCLHPNSSIINLQVFTGIGDLSGRSFMALKPTGTSEDCVYMVETSATLETN